MTPPWIAAFCALWVLVLLLAFLVLGTLRRLTALLERVPEAPLLGAAPTTFVEPFELRENAGRRITSEELLVEPATILLFIKPDCRPCVSLLERLEGVGDHIEGVPFYVVAPESRLRLELPRGLPLLYDEDGDAARSFSNQITPQAYAVGTNRMVLDSRVPASFDDLAAMANFQRDGGGEALAKRLSVA